MRKPIDKKYIYLRDQKRCYFCGKELKMGSLSVDHYFPKSLGGTYDLFNLVASCKNCNRLKKSCVPDDWKEVAIKLFIKAVEEYKIFTVIPMIKHKEVVEWVRGITIVERDNEFTVFENANRQFYVKQNKIYRIESV